MKRQALLIGSILAVATLLAVSLLAVAQDGRQTPGADYDLSWWTVDGGGSTFMTGSGFSLGGTAGQADAGVLTGEGYTLGGGFWRGGAVVGGMYRVYLPLVVRGYP